MLVRKGRRPAYIQRVPTTLWGNEVDILTQFRHLDTILNQANMSIRVTLALVIRSKNTSFSVIVLFHTMQIHTFLAQGNLVLFSTKIGVHFPVLKAN